MASIHLSERNRVQGWRTGLLCSTALCVATTMGHAQTVIEDDVSGGTGAVVVITGPEERADQIIRNITSSNGNAVFVNGPTAVLTGNNLTIETSGTSGGSGGLSAAVRVHGGANVELSAGSVATTGASDTRGILGVNGASIVTNGTAISTSGANSHGVHVQNAAAGLIQGGSISTVGSDSFGLYSQNAGSILTARDVEVATNGFNGFGAFTYGGGSFLELSGGSITTTGEQGKAVVAGSDSSIQISGTTITTGARNAWGLVADQANSSITANDVEITTGGERGYGAHTANGGEIAITGGTIDTEGSRGYGLYSTGAGSVINASDVAISTLGDWTFGAYATDGGTISLNGGSITTEGKRAFGILASTGGAITSNANVTTTGARAHGVQSGENTAGDSGTVNLTGGTITTGGNDAFGLHALATGTISATGDVVINTTGVNGFGAFAESDSSIDLDGTTVRTTGANGFGLLVNNDRSTTGGTIAANSVDVRTTGAGAEAARIENGGEMTISNSRLDAQNAAGIALVDNATVTLNNTEITSSQESISSTLNQGGQTQTINIGNGTVATTNSGTLLNVTRSGDGATGIVNLNLGAGSTTQGDIIDEGTRTTGGTDVTLEEGASWSGLLRGVRSFLGLQDGEVNFEGEADIAGNLEGNGTSFIFSDQGGTIGGNVGLNNGSRTTGGTIGNRINVVGDVDVDETSTMGGNWSIGGDLSNAGTLTPGNSIGRVSVAGDLLLAPTSIYQVDIDATGASDLVEVGGTATLDGTVTVTPLGGFALSSPYTILTASALVGQFDENVGFTQGGAFLDAFLSYDPDTVFLTIERNDVEFASVAETPNQTAVAGALDQLPLTNALASAIALGTAEGAALAFDQLSGEIHASANTVLVEDSRFIRNAANDRIRAAFGNVAAAPLPVMAYGPDGRLDKAPGFAPEAIAPDYGTAAWGTVFGSWGSTDGNGNSAELDRSTAGVLAGIDGMMGTWRVGALAGYSHSSFDVDDRASSGSTDNFHLGLYGGTQWGAVGFRTGLAYTWSDVETQRSVAFPGFADSLSADYDAGTFQVFGELGYSIETGAASFEPFINLAHVNVRTDSFTETGGAAALTSARSRTDTTFTTLGLRASTDFAMGDMTATARGMIGWRHAFGDRTPYSTHAFAGGDVFSVAGAPIAEDAAVIEAGLDFAVTPAATLGISYNGQFGSGASEHGGRIGLDVKF